MADDTGDEVPEGQVRMHFKQGDQWAVVTEEQFEKVWQPIGWERRSSKARSAEAEVPSGAATKKES